MKKSISPPLSTDRERSSKEQALQLIRKRRTRLINRVAVRLSHETPIPLKDVIGELEKKVIVQVLSEVDGNQKDAAETLGMKYTTLNEKLKRYGIRVRRVSMILLSGFFLYFSLASSARADDDPIKKDTESLEIMNCEKSPQRK